VVSYLAYREGTFRDHLFDFRSDDVAPGEIRIGKDFAEDALGEQMLHQHPLDRLLRQLAADSGVTEASLDELERVLQHHLAKQRLGHVWSVKQIMLQRLEAKTGQISERLRSFVSHTLGNPAIDDMGVQRSWSDLMQELGRIHGLRSFLASVADVTERIAFSGAPFGAML
jgi:hypothetical protein